MYKKLIGIIAVAFTLILNQASFAHSWGCGEGMKHMLESLQLSDAQKAKVQPIMDQLKSTMKATGSQMAALDTQIHQQVVSATMDQSTVDGLVDQKTKLIGDMMKAKITAKNQIFSILTPEQKTNLQGMMTKLENKIAEQFKSCHPDE